MRVTSREFLDPRPSTTDLNMLNHSTASLPAVVGSSSSKPRKLTPLIKPTLEEARIRCVRPTIYFRV